MGLGSGRRRSDRGVERRRRYLAAVAFVIASNGEIENGPIKSHLKSSYPIEIAKRVPERFREKNAKPQITSTADSIHISIVRKCSFMVLRSI